jgi:heme exporter protein B
VAKSFLQDSKGRMLYYYKISGAANFIIAKMVFNAFLMILMSFLTLIMFILLLGNPIIYFFKFLLVSFIGGIGLSLLFTFLAAIAAKAQQQAALMAIMGFPIAVPQLLLLGKISSRAFSDVVQAGWLQMLLLLVCLDILIVILSIILFPFLWKD